MRGPIDFIVVGFEGNKFDGSILNAIGDAIDKGIIDLVAMGLLMKDGSGNVTTMSVADIGDSYAVEFTERYKAKNSDKLSEDDIDEVAELLEKNTAAGILVVEQLWAIPLKQALINANGVLIAEGRIHPEAAAELNN